MKKPVVVGEFPAAALNGGLTDTQLYEYAYAAGFDGVRNSSCNRVCVHAHVPEWQSGFLAACRRENVAYAFGG